MTNLVADRFRQFFSFRYFNRMQSECFDFLYHGNSHVVVSSPTGSGKTVLLELAILKVLRGSNPERNKIIYIAPMKALCHERCQDWKRKFAYLNFTCNELTGDTAYSEIGHIKQSNIMYVYLLMQSVTTPEKWDSVTRRWRDHQEFMGYVRLVLVLSI